MRGVFCGALLALSVGFAGCASTPAAPPEGADFSISESHPLYAVKSRMSEVEVRNVAGNPDDSRSYMTGKQWIPFYFGSDTHRTEWIYEGEGVVVFSRNRYSGGLSAIEVRDE